MIYQTEQELLSVGHVSNFDFVAHAHHNIEILVCTDGAFRVSCNFCTQTLTQGQAMIAFSNDVHSYFREPTGRGIIMIVSPSLFGDFLPDVSGKRYDNFVLERADVLLACARSLLEEYRGERNMEIMVGYLHVILGSMLKRLSYTEQSATDVSLLSRVLRYVSENYTQPLTLRSLAHTFGISEAHLSRTFSQRISCNFVRYLHNLRIEQAKKLLLTSRRSIIDIALESGFSDIRTFNRVFRELEGMAPSEYRQMQNPT